MADARAPGELEPARALFVADDRVNDMRGSKAVGLRTAWLAPGHAADPEPAADHRLERLADVLALLEDEDFDT